MGLDSTIYVKIKFKTGFELTREVCYWRKHWGLRNYIMNNILGGEKIGVMNYSLNKGDLAEIQELLINICNDTSKIPEYDYFGNMSNFISSCYRNAGEIQKILLLLKDHSFIYEYLGDDEYERAGRFTENNDLIIEIESIEVYFEDSY